MLYHTRNTEDVARNSHSNLDTYLISAGKVLWNFTGERRGPGPRSAGIALHVHVTLNPVLTGELIMSDLKKSGKSNPPRPASNTFLSQNTTVTCMLHAQVLALRYC